MPPAVSAVVIAYDSSEAARRTAEDLLAQTLAPLEVIVVDNHPAERTADALDALRHEAVRILRPGRNLGYCRACDLAAGLATGEWVFFCNPDARPEPDCLERLLEAAAPGVGILGAQVLLPEATVNAGANPVHLSGLSWSGGYGGPREHGAPRDVACVSGAALAIRTELYRRLGGHCPAFDMYYDDVDLAWRARLAGERVRFVPSAVVIHDYAFERGMEKWFQLEHNRLWAVLSNYRLGTLVILAPLLAAVELGVMLKARREGWAPQKRRAWRVLARHTGDLRRWRHDVQQQRRVPDAEIVALMAATVDTPLAPDALLRRVNPWMERYRRAIIGLLRA